MEKFNRCLKIDVVKELANELCVDFINYFHTNNIEIKETSKNEMVKMYWKMVDLKNTEVYDCKDAQEFNELICTIQEVRKTLNATK